MNSIITIVVTYNRKELLAKCLECILAQECYVTDILVIDNNSTDDTKSMIDELYGDNSRVIYVNTGTNIGGAGGFSFGINYAVNMGYDYLWIMDDDTMPDSGALRELMSAAELLHDDFGYLSSFVKWTDGSACIMNIPAVNPIKWQSDVLFQSENHLLALDSASFVSILIRSKVVKKVGLPIKEFFIWADDVEYTLRISRDYPSYFVYSSQVIHAIKSNIATSIVDEEDDNRIGRYRYLYRNRYYIACHHSFRAWVSYVLEMWSTIGNILMHSKNKKLRRCSIVLKSSIAGLFFHPRIDSVHPINESDANMLL